MTGKLRRSIAAIALASVTAVSPVAPAWAQNQPANQPQAPAQAQQPSQQPAAQQTPSSAGAAPVQKQGPSTAQTQPQTTSPFAVSLGPDFTRLKPAFPNVLAPYSPIQVDQPQFVNSLQLQQFIHDGKLQLSLQDAVGLALQNNLDIAVNRYWSWIAETDILRTKGGGGQRGVPIVGTPLAIGNLPALSFDPLLTGTLGLDKRKSPINNPIISGVGITSATQSLLTDTALANFEYAQSFHTGTTLALTYDNTRASTSSPAVLFNPNVQSVGTITVTQNLLNGFGLAPNERFIRMALVTKRTVDAAFVQTIITDITGVENDYWELVFARGNVGVQQRAVDLAQQLYEDNKKQVEIGTLAPIEIVRAEAQLATAQQALIAAQTVQLQQQLLLLSVIAKNPAAPELQNVEIVPTDTVQNPPQLEGIPLQNAVSEALTKRPDVAEARMVIEGDNINIKSTRNALLPSLTFSGFWSAAGLGGNSKITTTTPALGAPLAAGIANGAIVPASGLTPSGAVVPIFLSSSATTVNGVAPGGFGDAMSEVFHGRFPDYSAQLALNIPIRNRVAQADSARAQLSERQDQARLQLLINNVVVDVQNALNTLQQDRAGLVAAQKARELQEQTLDAEQKKLQLGASTIFLVVTAQQQLSAAAATEVRAGVDLEEAQVNLERALGRTLEARSITIANAKTGQAPKDTLIPGTTATGQLAGAREALANSAKP